MVHILVLFFAGVFATTSLTTFANDQDKQDMAEAKKVFNDKKQRTKIPEMDKTNQELDTLSKEDSQTVISLAMEILDSIAGNNDYDAEKIKALLSDAYKDPDSFFNKLSPEQQAQIRKLSSTDQE